MLELKHKIRKKKIMLSLDGKTAIVTGCGSEGDGWGNFGAGHATPDGPPSEYGESDDETRPRGSPFGRLCVLIRGSPRGPPWNPPHSLPSPALEPAPRPVLRPIPWPMATVRPGAHPAEIGRAHV